LELVRQEMERKEEEFKSQMLEKEKHYREEEANKKMNAEKKAIFTEKTNNIQLELNEANEIAKNFNRNMLFTYELIGGVGNQH